MSQRSYMPAQLPSGVSPEDYRRAEQIAVRKGLQLLNAKRDRHGLTDDEVIHEALLGVYQALRTFDPELGYPFSHYASCCAFGVVWNLLRDWHRGHIPRRVWEQTHSRAGCDRGVEPWFREWTSLDALRGPDESVPGHELLSVVDHGHEEVLTGEFWRYLLEHLRPKERLIFERIQFGDESQLEIGRDLGISQMHVSRLYRRARATLQELARQALWGAVA